jgi:hypothetical protein
LIEGHASVVKRPCHRTAAGSARLARAGVEAGQREGVTEGEPTHLARRRLREHEVVALDGSREACVRRPLRCHYARPCEASSESEDAKVPLSAGESHGLRPTLHI